MCLVSSFSYAKNWTKRGGLIKEQTSRNKSWLNLAHTDSLAIDELLKVISTSSPGEKLVLRARMKAREQDMSLSEVIKVGEVSLTDTTLIRRFSPKKANEVEYRSKSIVYINRSLNVKDAVLDLAHELTHFVHKKTFNPYVDTFSAKGFLADTIESKGGEVDAFLVECQVGYQVFGSESLSDQCMNILDNDGHFSRAQAIKEFYKLGVSYDDFLGRALRLGLNVSSLPISRETEMLVSSAWGAPYPNAVLEEFETIMSKVCKNDQKRLSYLKSQETRFPASAPVRYNSIYSNFVKRCGFFIEL